MGGGKRGRRGETLESGQVGQLFQPTKLNLAKHTRTQNRQMCREGGGKERGDKEGRRGRRGEASSPGLPETLTGFQDPEGGFRRPEEALQIRLHPAKEKITITKEECRKRWPAGQAQNRQMFHKPGRTREGKGRQSGKP